MNTVLLLIASLIGLCAGTNFVVNAALKICERFKVSKVFIGLTVLAVGTDLPELVVAIRGAMSTSPIEATSGVIIGNALGSAICQISIVLGLFSIFYQARIKRVEILRNAPWLAGSLLALVFIGYDGAVSKMEGMFLVLFYLAYYIYLCTIEEVVAKRRSKKRESLIYALGQVGLGLAVVIACADVVVGQALELADHFGIRESVVGFLIISLGTSLPELAVGIMAAFKKASGMSFGNILGSNIFDQTLPIGIAAVIKELNFEKSILYFDIPVLTIFTAFVVLAIYLKEKVNRQTTSIIICAYLFYVILKSLGA